MTIVKGQIDSLKQIKAELGIKGITRFSSIGDIKSFYNNYESEKQDIIGQIEQELIAEIATLEADKFKFKEKLDNIKVEESNLLFKKIDKLRRKYNLVNAKKTNSQVKIFNALQIILINIRIWYLEKNFNRIIHIKTITLQKKLADLNDRASKYSMNRESIVSDRSLPKISELANTKKVVDKLYPLIAGAIGENLVVTELKKLSDKNILFNDYSIDFKTPIYNRKENDKIFSIQIDHLLITNSGIFLIETKNWSKESINNIDLRSPINQIKRTNYALYAILNSGSRHLKLNLKRHHWGDKKLPIRSVVVMINNKPKEKFKYVAVKTLKELNGYISYFDPILEDSEVNSISEYLEMIRN